MTQGRERRPIDWLVNWALEGQGMAGALLGDPAGRGWSALVLGTRVDVSPRAGGGGMLLVDAPEYDAVLVAEAVRGLPQEQAALVVRFGRLGYGEFARPDWCPEGEGHWEVVRTATGKIRYDYADQANRRGERRPRMQFVGNSAAHVAFWRGQYALWWEGLMALVPVVNQGLMRHEALPPAAPEAPWREGAPVVHRAAEAGA